MSPDLSAPTYPSSQTQPLPPIQSIRYRQVMRKDRILERDHRDYVRAERDVLTAVVHPYIVTLRYSFQVRLGCVGVGWGVGWGWEPASAVLQGEACGCRGCGTPAPPPTPRPLAPAHAAPQTPKKLYLVLDFINGGHLFFQVCGWVWAAGSQRVAFDKRAWLQQRRRRPHASVPLRGVCLARRRPLHRPACTVPQLYRQGTFDEPLARLYCAEIVLAITHLHGLGFVHRCAPELGRRVGGWAVRCDAAKRAGLPSAPSMCLLVRPPTRLARPPARSPAHASCPAAT